MNHVHEILQRESDVWSLFTAGDDPNTQSKNAEPQQGHSARHPILTPQASMFLRKSDFEADYPDDRTFAVCLTHDVEELYPPLTHTLASAFSYLKVADIGGVWRSFFWKMKGKSFSPYRNFDKIMKMERVYGAKSSFYFIATPLDVLRFRYDVEDALSEIATIADKGWEVGLHGGYYSYVDLDSMIREKKRLEKVLGKTVTGYRNHYLRFKVPDTWELLAQAGFEYDTTFGYSSAVGFRNGMCHPFVPFNVHTRAPINILELPLVIMDGALFSCTASLDEAWQLSKTLIDVTERCNGLLTVLWHNYVFCSPFWSKWARIYEAILRYCSEKGAWMTSGEEICSWWRERGY